jgi:hypothetical protein
MKGCELTYQDVLSQLLHTLLDTEYNTPSVFLLAGYSTVLQVSGLHPQLLHFYKAFLREQSDKVATC